MKKTILNLVLGITLVSSSANAGMWDVLKDYGLPCAAGLAGGLLASKDEGGAIGLGVCLGVGTSTYLTNQRQAQKMRDEDFKQMMKMVDEHQAGILAAQDAKVEKALADHDAKQKVQVDGIKQLMKEVIAERMSLIGDEVKADVKRHMDNAVFMQDLEKKVMAKMKEEVRVESELRKKEIVDKCVEEALQQLVLKKVGAPTEAQ